MSLLIRVQDKINSTRPEYNKEYYEEKMIELGIVIVDFVRLNSNDKELVEETYKKVFIIMIELCNKQLYFQNKNPKLSLEVLIYEKDSEILLHPKIILYNFLGQVIKCHASKYDVFTLIKIGEKLKINIKDLMVSIVQS